MNTPTTPSEARKRPRTTGDTTSNRVHQGFVTLHEERLELERTEHHFPSLAALVETLDDAVQAKWPKRQVPYQSVIAMLVHWEEDDLGVRDEIASLAEVLRGSYNFDVQTWAIPSGKRGYINLLWKLESIITQYDSEDNLFILYYGGHACQDEQPQPTWVSKRNGGSSFNSSAILHLFQELDADALLLFDSCQAVPQAFNSTGKGVVSAVTATGFEPGPTGMAAEVGSNSFTNSITQVLGKLSIPLSNPRAPPSDVLLHTLLITELKKYTVSLEKLTDGSFKRDANGHHLLEPFRRRTPIHTWLSANKPPRSILLSPLQKGNVSQHLSSAPRQAPVYDYVAPEVLISVRLTPDALLEADVDAWAKWILSLPSGATDVTLKGRAVKIEGLYRSYSSLVVLRMPAETWTCLPKYRAFNFIGYITGENQAQVANRAIAARVSDLSLSGMQHPILPGDEIWESATSATAAGSSATLDTIPADEASVTTLQEIFDHLEDFSGLNVQLLPTESDRSEDLPAYSKLAVTSAIPDFCEHRRDRFWSRIRGIRPLLFLLATSSVFCIAFCLFVYFYLVCGNSGAALGVILDASTINIVVSLLSQLSAILVVATITAFLATVRPILASRARGLSWASWTSQGHSGWLTVLQVAAAGRFSNTWSLIRLSLPFLALALGSIIKFQADFKYFFVPSADTVPVYAGLMPPSDFSIFKVFSVSDLSMLFTSFGTGILSSAMYALPHVMDGCDGDCRSFILPGPIGLARQVSTSLNSSLYSNQFLHQGTNALRIANATAVVLQFIPPDPEDLKFNVTTECVYGGALDEGFQICIRQDGFSIVAGWSHALCDRSQCIDDKTPTWRMAPVVTGTRMTLFELDAATSYSVSTQKILDIAPLSPTRPRSLSAADYIALFTAVFAPPPPVSPEELASVHQLISATSWAHRTYSKIFSDEPNYLVMPLQNLLAIPLQFCVTSIIYANYTASERGRRFESLYPLPDSMITEASTGTSSTRFVIEPYTGWIFITVDVAIHLGILAWAIWFIYRPEASREAVDWNDTDTDTVVELDCVGGTGVVEVDTILAAAKARVFFTKTPDRMDSWDYTEVSGEQALLEPGVVERGEAGSFLSYILNKGSSTCVSAWQVARESRNLRIRQDFRRPR